MHKIALINLLYFISIVHTKAQTNDKQQLIVEVISTVNNAEPIGGAVIRIKGFDAETTINSGIDKGRALFKNIPIGDYDITIRAEGYRYFRTENEVKVTAQSIGMNNEVVLKMIPLPDDSFYISGRVVDEETGIMPVDSVKVNFRTTSSIPLNKITYTDEFGYYDFFFENQEIKEDDEFTLDFKKERYTPENEERNVSKNRINVPNIRFKKKVIKEQKGPASLYIDMAPEGGYFYSKNNAQVGFMVSAMISYKPSRKRTSWVYSLGGSAFLNLSSKNTFETLTGEESSVETNYNIYGGFLQAKKYFKISKDSNLLFFASAKMIYEYRKPNPALISQDNFKESSDSYEGFRPSLSSGLSLKLGSMTLEPFLSLSYLDLSSQDFIFNYFGRGDPIEAKEKFIPITLGVNIGLPIQYHSDENLEE